MEENVLLRCVYFKRNGVLYEARLNKLYVFTQYRTFEVRRKSKMRMWWEQLVKDLKWFWLTPPWRAYPAKPVPAEGTSSSESVPASSEDEHRPGTAGQ